MEKVIKKSIIVLLLISINTFYTAILWFHIYKRNRLFCKCI